MPNIGNNAIKKENSAASLLFTFNNKEHDVYEKNAGQNGSNEAKA